MACNKESEDEEEEDEENDAGDQVENEKDAFLKEVGVSVGRTDVFGYGYDDVRLLVMEPV